MVSTDAGSAAARQGDPLGLRGVDFAAERLALADGARLLVLRWKPQRPSGRPILFVPGWVSALAGWVDLLRVLALEHPIYYVETREKSSAELPRLACNDFRIAALAGDLQAAVAALGLRAAEIVVMGSSLGASVLLECMKGGRLQPHAAFLVGPTCHFRFPWWGRLIMLLPSRGYTLVKYFVLWYLRTFRVDAQKEPEQMRRYEQTLRVAHPRRIKMSARAVAGYQVWPGLETIRTPVGIAYAESDTLHGASDIRRLVRALPRAAAFACPSNSLMHSAALKPDLERFLAQLD